jgi:hypothetical protein
LTSVPNKDSTEILYNNKQYNYIKQTYESKTMACGASLSNRCVAKDPAPVFQILNLKEIFSNNAQTGIVEF